MGRSGAHSLALRITFHLAGEVYDAVGLRLLLLKTGSSASKGNIRHGETIWTRASPAIRKEIFAGICGIHGVGDSLPSRSGSKYSFCCNHVSDATRQALHTAAVTENLQRATVGQRSSDKARKG